MRAATPTLDWLEEFLSPWFVPQEPAAGADQRVVELHVDADRFRRAVLEAKPTGRSVECFVLDRPAAPVPLVHLDDGAPFAFDRSFGFAIRVDEENAPARVEILAEGERPAARLAVMRVVRELAAAHAARNGAVALHAAAVASEDGVTLFAGPRYSGKSTLLVHALEGPGTRFVANDRLLLDAAAPHPRAHGVPTIVRLREGTLERAPRLQAEILSGAWHYTATVRESRACRASGAATPAAPHRWPPGVSAAQLASLLGVGCQASGRLARIVFPRIVRGGVVAGHALRRLSPDMAAAQLLSEGLFAGGRHAGFLLAGMPSQDTSVRRRLRDVCSSVPCFVCELGPRAYSTPSAWQSIRGAAAAGSR